MTKYIDFSNRQYGRIKRLAARFIDVVRRRGPAEALRKSARHIASFARAKVAKPQPLFKPSPEAYRVWLKDFEEINAGDRIEIQKQIEQATLPVVDIILRVSRRHEVFFNRAIAGIERQLYSPRRVHIVCDSRFRRPDLRFEQKPSPSYTFVNEPHHCTLAQGADLFVLLDSDCQLSEQAVFCLAIQARSDVSDMWTMDHDRMDRSGKRFAPFFKPQFSPLLQKSTDYIGGCVAVSSALTQHKTLFEAIFNARNLADTAISLGPMKIRHLPHVLFSKLSRQSPNSSRNKRIVTAAPTCSVEIIIPTRDKLTLLKECIESIADVTDYPPSLLTVTVIDNGSTDSDTLKYLREGERSGLFRVKRAPGPFNYSRLNNDAAGDSGDSVLVFLNNDIKILEPYWLTRLVEVAILPETGFVGAKLLYEDGMVQHAGILIGVGGPANHAHVGLPISHGGYHDAAKSDHEVSAVTAACMAVRREVFVELGGFDENLPITFNDVLICLRALESGYRNVVLNTVHLIHRESQTRGADTSLDRVARIAVEAAYVRSRLKPKGEDAFYSPNLSREIAFEVAVPPRARKPWRRLGADPQRLTVLMLSSTHQKGYGVPVVIAQQAAHMVGLGWEVDIGGPNSDNDIAYPGCRRVVLMNAKDAAIYAVQTFKDCIVAHTPPFYGAARFIGDGAGFVAYDYGEPPPDFFNDADHRRNVLLQKAFDLGFAHRRLAISNSVRAESGMQDVGVVPLGNTHLACWDPAMRARRKSVREAEGWERKVVLLTVCRFTEAERRYKGVDDFLALGRLLTSAGAKVGINFAFVLCGKAGPQDVAWAESGGAIVKPNVSDHEMTGLYAAADVYLSFSRWEGWNLGLAQCLAMGLPAIALDTQAHKDNFSILTVHDPFEAASPVLELAHHVLKSNFEPKRNPVYKPWKAHLEAMASEIESVCAKLTTTSA